MHMKTEKETETEQKIYTLTETDIGRDMQTEMDTDTKKETEIDTETEMNTDTECQSIPLQWTTLSQRSHILSGL